MFSQAKDCRGCVGDPGLMPTSLDNGQRSPRKLLAAVVRRLIAAVKRR
jgi:hypothetical protein